jgi:hypothetical protein
MEMVNLQFHSDTSLSRLLHNATAHATPTTQVPGTAHDILRNYCSLMFKQCSLHLRRLFGIRLHRVYEREQEKKKKKNVAPPASYSAAFSGKTRGFLADCSCLEHSCKNMSHSATEQQDSAHSSAPLSVATAVKELGCNAKREA